MRYNEIFIMLVVRFLSWELIIESDFVEVRREKSLKELILSSEMINSKSVVLVLLVSCVHLANSQGNKF